MPGYGKKLNTQEIWEVVVYVRALQNMTRATTAEKRRINRKAKK